MLVQRGGNTVQAGTYWNIANGQRVDIAQESTLPGEAKTMYVRMSTAGILVAGPVLGLLFAAFLPFIGIAMTISLLGKKLAKGLVSTSVMNTSFGWRPIEAYLEGKERKKKEQEAQKKEAKGDQK
jgi:hypothetical protein